MRTDQDDNQRASRFLLREPLLVEDLLEQLAAGHEGKGEVVVIIGLEPTAEEGTAKARDVSSE